MNPTETSEMQGLVAELKAEGLTILLIEHKLEMVMRLSDRVIVMDEGKKIAEGAGEEVRNDARVIEAYLGHGLSKPAARVAGDGGMNGEATPSGPLLRLSNINTFYGQAQVHFDLSIERAAWSYRVPVGRQCQRQIDDDEDYSRPGAAALGRTDLRRCLDRSV